MTIFVDQRKLSRGPEVGIDLNSTSALTLEALHQLAASYFIDRESTLRKLHHLQIASSAIKVKHRQRHTVEKLLLGNGRTTLGGGGVFSSWFEMGPLMLLCSCKSALYVKIDFIYLWIYVSFYLPTYLSLYLSTDLCVFLSTYLPIPLSIYGSMCLSIYLPT